MDYSGPFLYENNVLKCIFTSAGRILVFTDNGSVLYKFEYNLQDHLGNTRVVFSGHSSGKTELIQQTDYYPFGLVMAQQEYIAYEELPGHEVLKNKNLYNGKEWQDDEIGGVKLDWYDYGARMYDPELGRWHVPDPMTDFFPENSPYAYALNSPINYIDLYGLSPIDWLKKLFGRNDKYLPWYKPNNGYHPKKTHSRQNSGSNHKRTKPSSKSKGGTRDDITHRVLSLPIPTPTPQLTDIPLSSLAAIPDERPRNQSNNDAPIPFAGSGVADYSNQFFKGGSWDEFESTQFAMFNKWLDGIVTYLNNNSGINIDIDISTGADPIKLTRDRHIGTPFGEVAIKRGITIMGILEKRGISPNRLNFDPQSNVHFGKEWNISIKIVK